LEVCARRRPTEPRPGSEASAPPPDVGPAVEVLRRLVDRAHEASLRGFRHAERTSAGTPPP
jgi:hypothetical protein